LWASQKRGLKPARGKVSLWVGKKCQGWTSQVFQECSKEDEGHSASPNGKTAGMVWYLVFTVYAERGTNEQFSHQPGKSVGLHLLGGEICHRSALLGCGGLLQMDE
jgi:hypothetical protein